MSAVDLTKWHKVNLWPLQNGDLAVRPGFRKQVAAPDSSEYVAGFSIANSYTGEVWHYVFYVSTTGPKNLTLLIYDDDGATFQTFVVGVDVIPRGLGVAKVFGQLLINSPDMPPLWGPIGGGVTFARKVNSDTSQYTALEIQRGITCSWCGRAMVASGVSVFASNAVTATGGSPQTFLAANQMTMPGIVYGMHEAAGGMLVLLTSEGVYGIDSTAAASGILGDGNVDVRLLNHHKTTSFDSSCVVRGRVFALTERGYALVDTESDDEVLLSEPMQSRAIGTRIDEPDYRTGRMLAGDAGPFVALEERNAMLVSHVSEGFRAWWTSGEYPTDFQVRGLLRDSRGAQQLVCANGIFAIDGNFDGGLSFDLISSTQPVGAFVGIDYGSGKDLALPSNLRTARHMHVSAAAGGASGAVVKVAVRGSLVSSPLRADLKGLTIGTDAWGTTTKRWTTTPLSSIDVTHGETSGEMGIEVGVSNPLTRIGTIADFTYATAPRPENDA